MNLDQLEHRLWLCEQGLRPEDAPIIREQIKALKAEQDQELLQSLEAAKIYEGMSQEPYFRYPPPDPAFQLWMGMDEFIHQRELRESAEGLP